MSRIGKLPVPLPKGVKTNVTPGRVAVEGPKGKLEMSVDSDVEVTVEDGHLVVKRKDDSRRARGLHGMTRKLISNMVTGVTQGFTRVLEINGVGYRADVKGNAIHLTLGFSHPILFQ